MPTSATARHPRTKKTSEPSDDQNKRLVEQAIADAKRLAESRLEMARLFLSRGLTDVAMRRLRELIELHPETDEAKEALRLLG